jgi:hypothetical protein
VTIDIILSLHEDLLTKGTVKKRYEILSYVDLEETYRPVQDGYRFVRASHKLLLISLAVTYRRMNLPPSAQQVTDPQRLTAPTLRWLHSYLQYIRFVKYAKATETNLQLQEINLA